MQMDKQQQEVIGWISTVLGENLDGGTFYDLLKDGVRLCKLLNKVSSQNIEYRESKQIFVQRENICSFINGLRALGMNEYELFQTNDLFEERDIKQVIICLYALSRQLQKEKTFTGPFIGPHLATQSKIEFSQEVLNRSKYAVPLQMGYTPEAFDLKSNEGVGNDRKAGI